MSQLNKNQLKLNKTHKIIVLSVNSIYWFLQFSVSQYIKGNCLLKFVLWCWRIFSIHANIYHFCYYYFRYKLCYLNGEILKLKKTKITIPYQCLWKWIKVDSYVFCITSNLIFSEISQRRWFPRFFSPCST